MSRPPSRGAPARGESPQAAAVPAASLVVDERAVVRPVRAARVWALADAFDDADTMPALRAARHGASLILLDGHHRLTLARERRWDQVPCIVEQGPAGDDFWPWAWRRALSEAVVGPASLTRPEKRAAALRIVDEDPNLSFRAVGRMVGVDHKTIAAWLHPEKAAGRPRRPPPIDLGTWLDAAVGFAEHIGAQDVADELLRRPSERAIEGAVALDRLASGVLEDVRRFLDDEADEK